MPRAAIRIEEITAGNQWVAIYPLIRQTNPDMTRKQFNDRLKAMLKGGYRCIGAWQGKTLVGVAGFWTGTRFWCGKYIDIDNVVVAKKSQRSGVGAAMMKWLDKEGKRQKCDISVLDSYTTFHDAHKFYFRQGYVILGYHFTKKY